MKANEAPEKIYLEKVYPDNGVLPNGLNYNQSSNDIEYTRTDAFIEKAASYLNSKLYDWVRIEHLNPSIFPNVIIKQDFIEDFKKYMEGE